MPILTRLRQWFQRQRCPEPNPMLDNPWPLDPARMARLELQVQTLEDKLDGLAASHAVPDVTGQGDMDAHLGAN
jgi:hypothetical protein